MNHASLHASWEREDRIAVRQYVKGVERPFVGVTMGAVTLLFDDVTEFAIFVARLGEAPIDVV